MKEKMDKERIQEQAKKIMDEFSKALDRVEKVDVPIGFEREQNLREFILNQADKEFRERMLKNAPKRKGDYLVAEKKHW
ncbi:hypothetical protein HYS48_04875 [Candidatus Woesearchaeota archaeon]|nr:hypothetical protein [Candidatus Woesearchaeota archaeon]